MNKKYVSIVNNRPTTTSRLIAHKFGKRHDNVLKAIKNLECSDKFNALNFKGVEYKDKKGEYRSEYQITYDGFTMLVMGFTGKKAMQFKEEYIAEFNAMRDSLAAQSVTTERELTRLEILTIAIEAEKEVLQLKQVNKELAKEAAYTQEVLKSDNSWTVSVIAKELGMSARKLNAELKAKKVQYFNNGVWLLYAKYQDRQYTDTRTHPYFDSNDNVKTKISTVWTEKGRKFIHSLYSVQLSIE